MFLVYKLETFKNCKPGKAHYDYNYYDFLSYVIFDQQLKITFRKSSAPPMKKAIPPFLHTPPQKFKKCKSPLFANIENFAGLPLQKGGEDIVLTHCVKLFFG